MTMTLSLTDDLKQRVAEALADTPALFAYLFGSQVTGYADAESDADVAFFFEPLLPKSKRFDALLDAAGLVGQALHLGPFHTGVDPVSLNDAPLLLKHAAMSTGVLLYERDHAARVLFELSVFQERDDTQHYRRQYRRVFLKRILTDRA